MNWEVLASDSSDDEEIDCPAVQDCAKQAASTDAQILDDVETVISSPSAGIMDQIIAPPCSSSQENFRRRKKEKEKKMRRRMRHLHNSFTDLISPVKSVSKKKSGQVTSLDDTLISGNNNSQQSISRKSGHGENHLNFLTKDTSVVKDTTPEKATLAVFPEASPSSGLNSQYCSDLSINCVFLLACNEQKIQTPLCDDHEGAFRHWSSEVLRDSAFGEIVRVANEHFARRVAMDFCASANSQTRPDNKTKCFQSDGHRRPKKLKESADQFRNDSFGDWVQSERKRYAEEKRASENVLLVYHPAKERVSIASKTATTKNMSRLLNDSLKFTNKSDRNNCCACSCSALPSKARRSSMSTDAQTTTSFPFIGAYLCYRVMYLLQEQLRTISKQELRAQSPLACMLRDSQHTDHKRRQKHRRKRKGKCTKVTSLPSPHTQMAEQSDNSDSETCSNGRMLRNHANVSFYINPNGEIIVLDETKKSPPAAKSSVNHDSTPSGECETVDMWGCSFQTVENDSTARSRHSSVVRRSHTCSICLDILCHPCSLRRCGHVFCRGCLLSMLYAAAQADEFNQIPPFCALCREDFRASDIIPDRLLDTKLRVAYPIAYENREPECAILERRLTDELFGMDHINSTWDEQDAEEDEDLLNANDYMLQQAIAAECKSTVVLNGKRTDEVNSISATVSCDSPTHASPNETNDALDSRSNSNSSVSDQNPATCAAACVPPRHELRAARLKYYGRKPIRGS